MKPNTETVQTLALAVAFFVLFLGSLAGFKQTVADENNTQATTNEPGSLAYNDTSVSQAPLLANFANAAFQRSSPYVNSQHALAENQDEDEAEGAETPKEIHQTAQTRAKISGGDVPLMTKTDKREILWLARIIYSETKRSEEQKLVGWVVRNRVDTGYTGHTYEDVAKHSSQFSGLHPGDPRYEHNMSRWYSSSGASWESALAIAKEVYFADPSSRPFNKLTRHFYSPMAVSNDPGWVHGQKAVRVVKDPYTNQTRFAFYSRIR